MVLGNHSKLRDCSHMEATAVHNPTFYQPTLIRSTEEEETKAELRAALLILRQQRDANASSIQASKDTIRISKNFKEIKENEDRLVELFKQRTHLEEEISSKSKILTRSTTTLHETIFHEMTSVSSVELIELDRRSIPINIIKVHFNDSNQTLEVYLQKPSKNCSYKAVTTGSHTDGLAWKGELYLFAIPNENEQENDPNVLSTVKLFFKYQNLWGSLDRLYTFCIEVKCKTPADDDTTIFTIC